MFQVPRYCLDWTAAVFKCNRFIPLGLGYVNNNECIVSVEIIDNFPSLYSNNLNMYTFLYTGCIQCEPPKNLY